MILKTIDNMISGAYKNVSSEDRPKVTAGLMVTTALIGHLGLSHVDNLLSGAFTFVTGKDEYTCVINSNDLFTGEDDTITFIASSETMKKTGLDCAPT